MHPSRTCPTSRRRQGLWETDNAASPRSSRCRIATAKQAPNCPLPFLLVCGSRRTISPQSSHPMELQKSERTQPPYRLGNFHACFKLAQPVRIPSTSERSGISALVLPSESFHVTTRSNVTQSSWFTIHLPITILRQGVLPSLSLPLARYTRVLLVSTQLSSASARISHDWGHQTNLPQMQHVFRQISWMQQAGLRLWIPNVLPLPCRSRAGRISPFLSTLSSNWGTMQGMRQV